VSASPTSSAGAAAENALAAERAAEGPMNSQALGTGIGVGILLAAVTATLVAWGMSLRRRMKLDRLAGSAGGGAGVPEFGVRRPGVSV
jgi:hypothetical protein